MPWSLELTRPARKGLEELPSHDRDAVIRAFDRLLSNPGEADIKKLGGTKRRLRVGRWRVRFEMDNRSGKLRILRVLARKEAYR
jgi:mRNA-degrading endonuclease RelE of RelBE toxin-antitoxin system